MICIMKDLNISKNIDVSSVRVGFKIIYYDCHSNMLQESCHLACLFSNTLKFFKGTLISDRGKLNVQ